ncbi:uncharacterized protein LOC135483839 [Lineus longissimus]|uniref:uncharacterized protein LOC135483839 n=1 Tax=Lineus longissimus TaxID=88925 RepID=UPI00315D2F4C
MTYRFQIEIREMAVRSRKPAQGPQDDKNVQQAARKESFDQEETPEIMIDEKIAAIDQEIRTIHHFFVAKGFTPLEIERGAKPLLDSLRKANRQRLAITALKVAVLLLVAYGVVHYDPVYMLTLTYSRIAMVKLVLPYWDWQYLYDRQCAMENPYFEGDRIYKEDCEICDDLKGIPRETNISHVDLMEQYMNRDLPVIITDAIDDWPAMHKFNVTFLEQLFLKTPGMKDYSGCYFGSNLRSVHGNNKQFLKKAAAGILQNYYAHWENCMLPVAKGMREFYERPYFLPPSTDMHRVNWVFISKNYRGKNFKPIPLEAPFIWYAQLKGESTVKALPKYPCNETCQAPVETLQEGEMLFMTDRIWFLDYLPNGEGENIAIAAGGNFD